jgi:hypothetical protein
LTAPLTWQAACKVDAGFAYAVGITRVLLLRRRWEDRELADVALVMLDDDRGLEIDLQNAD